jgi:hypothetical protein
MQILVTKEGYDKLWLLSTEPADAYGAGFPLFTAFSSVHNEMYFDFYV